MKFKRCFSCMRELDEPGALCPYCGYDNTNDPPKQPERMLICGTKLNGKYVLGRALGEGGFGVTYIAWDTILETRVCIKEYFPSGAAMRNNTFSSNVSWIGNARGEKLKNSHDSFVREARKAARLRDLPSIVKVWEVFQENDTAYIVMDYIEGMSLKSYLDKWGSLGERACFELLSPVMRDLEEVHRREIIHRDISADNLMMRSDGSIILLDLGAAKDLSASNGQSSFLVAKKGYSPVEQYSKNGDIGPWTDVYAMCATIVYCVTGNMIPDPLERYGKSEIDLSKLTPAFAQALEKGLAIEPHQRIQSMGELHGLLEKACESAPETEPEKNPPPERRPDSSSVRAAAEVERTQAVDGALSVEQEPAEGTKDTPQSEHRHGGRLPVILTAAVLAAGGMAFALRGWLKQGEVLSPAETMAVTQTAAYDSEQAGQNGSEPADMPPPASSTVPTAEPTPSATPTAEPTPSATPTAEPTPEPVPLILSQPDGQELIRGNECTLAVLASSLNNGSLSYQWYSGESGQLSDAKPISGATSPVLTFTPDRDSCYWVAIWNSKGGRYSEAVYSDPAEIRLLEPTPPPTPEPTPPPTPEQTPTPPPTPKPLTPMEAETLYQEGRRYEEERDYTSALSAYETAADAGNAGAMTRLGMMYAQGSGVTRSAETSTEWLEKGMSAGNAEAALQLAINASSAGRYEQAASCYSKAIELGDTSAYFELAMMYYNAVGVERDYQKAMELFRKAAENGNGNAFYYIGNMYYYGQGVEADTQRATICWQKAEEMLGQTLILPTS